MIDPNALKFKLFLCHKTKEELRGTAALEYIKWGESKRIHLVPSVKNSEKWWSLSLDAANSIFVKEAHNTSAVFYNPKMYPADCRLYYADLSTTTILYLNSIIGAMLFEIYNRAGLGEGARSLMVSDYLQVPTLVSTDGKAEDAEQALKGIFSLPPRKLITPKGEKWEKIDTIVFDALNLTQGEREAVYEAVIELVEARLAKANSLVNPKSSESKALKKRMEAFHDTLGIWIGLPEVEENEEETESHYA